MARLRRSDCSGPGITRRRRGEGLVTHVQTAKPSPIARRSTEFVVWPYPLRGPMSGSVLGRMATSRRSGRTQPVADNIATTINGGWSVIGRSSIASVNFAEALPKLRARVDHDLVQEGLGRPRVLAAVVRLLDVGLFRIGGEGYADEHETFGVASLHQEHVRIRDGSMVFTYQAKGSIERTIEIRDDPVREVVTVLRRRRTGQNLFAYKQGRRWIDIHAPDVNDYIKDVVGGEFSAKDFRTWSGTVLAAAALAEYEPVADPRPRRREVAEAVAKVADHLGNTPAVSRSAYIDPRVIDRFEEGETIGSTLNHPPDLEKLDSHLKHGGSVYRAVEEAVIDLVIDDAGHGREAGRNGSAPNGKSMPSRKR